MASQPDKPSCCTQLGIFYPGRDKRCPKHATPEQRQLAADLEERAAKLGVLNGQGWPYGPNIDVDSRQRLLDWAEHHGLKMAKTRCQGMHWLEKGRCGVTLCNRLGLWMDHVTRWSRDGQPALIVAQPYGLHGKHVAEVGQLAARDGLHVSVDARGWYGWGTLAIEVWRQDAHDRYRKSVWPATKTVAPAE
jgi:hypothetical protein